MNRLPAPMGLLIQRDQPLDFSFDGLPYQGLQGDSIASALLANGRFLMSRSFKYHRPRGPLTMAGQDANSLVQLPREPNVLADAHALSAGLAVTAQNVNGSLDNDKDAYLGEELYHGRVAARVNRVYDEQVEPILKRIAVAEKNFGIGMDDALNPVGDG